MTSKSAKPKPARRAPFKKRELKALLSEVEALGAALRNHDTDAIRAIEATHPDSRASARNLLCSLALDRGEIDTLGDRLAALGVNRLGRREPDALDALDAVRRLLHHLKRQPSPERPAEALDPGKGPRLLERRTEALLGPAPRADATRILATLAGNRAGKKLHELVAAGACGLVLEADRGDADRWRRLLERARRSAERKQRRMPVWVALTGPRLETGEVVKGSAVLRWEPRRNQLGKLLSPARLWLTPEDQGEVCLQPVEAAIPVSGKLLHKVQTEDTVRFDDARGRRRELRIRGASRSGCLAEGLQTTYLESGAALHLERRGKLITSGRVGSLPRLDHPIVVFAGNPLILSREQLPGRPAVRDGGFLRSPARISCTTPEALDRVRAGERITFGDGTVAGVVESVSDTELRIRVTRAGRPEGRPIPGLPGGVQITDAGGSRIPSGFAIRFPDSTLDLPAFGPGDEPAIAFAARHADALLVPGAERPEDVEALGEALDRQGDEKVGMVLGIATRRGISALPDLLLAALRRPAAAVLIYPDALAVEIGPTGLGEALDEIRWLARAAHVPVICSSAALDRLARRDVLHPTEMDHALAGAAGDALVVGKGRHQVDIVRYLVEPAA